MRGMIGTAARSIDASASARRHSDTAATVWGDGPGSGVRLSPDACARTETPVPSAKVRMRIVTIVFMLFSLKAMGPPADGVQPAWRRQITFSLRFEAAHYSRITSDPSLLGTAPSNA